MSSTCDPHRVVFPSYRFIYKHLTFSRSLYVHFQNTAYLFTSQRNDTSINFYTVAYATPQGRIPFYRFIYKHLTFSRSLYVHFQNTAYLFTSQRDDISITLYRCICDPKRVVFPSIVLSINT